MYSQSDLRFASAAWDLTQSQMGLNDLQNKQATSALNF
jgi:hypothetical protein